jgi:hypothetical protein
MQKLLTCYRLRFIHFLIYNHHVGDIRRLAASTGRGFHGDTHVRGITKLVERIRAIIIIPITSAVLRL